MLAEHHAVRVGQDGEGAQVEHLVIRAQSASPLASMSGPLAWNHLMCAASRPAVMLPMRRSNPHTQQRYS